MSLLPYLLAVIIPTVLVVYLWRYLGWTKTILLAIATTAVDIDHFLFGSKGFLEIPQHGEKILHAFNYGIEFTITIVVLNLFAGMKTIKLGLKKWLFPEKQYYKSNLYFYFTWFSRILLLGMLIHYALDLPIYILKNKWGYYDYSIIHYLINRK